MYLIVGLGNPEEDYSNTRHNMGFDTINKISKKYGIEVNQKKFKGLIGKGIIEGKKVILLKPQTFMNLSGESIRECIDFYKIDIKNLIIIYDDIDIEPGIIKLRKKGGAGSHNGMKSVVSQLKTTDFCRIRIGIGCPEDKANLIEYVIGAIDEEEVPLLEEGVCKASKALEEILKNGFDIAMNKYN